MTLVWTAKPTRSVCPAVRTHARLPWALGLLVAVTLTGCDYDSWMDPSRTGYFEHTPTSIPILRKIDVIEVDEDAFATEMGPPTATDLVAGSPEYIFAAGDGIDVQINDLFQVDKPEQFKRTIDQSGKILLPIVGSIQAAGMSQTDLVAAITEKLRPIIRDPRVDVTILEGRAFTFMVDGEVRNAGVYSLSRPDFDIEQAVALAGGANQGVRRVRVVRTLKLDESAAKEMAAGGTAPAGTAEGKPSTTPNTASPSAPATPAEPPPSVDDLLKQIQAPATAAPSTAPSTAPGAAPSDPSQPIEPIAPASNPAAPASPGALRSPSMVVDVDQLEAPRVAETSVPHSDAAVQTPPTQQGATEARYVFDTQKQEWVYVPAGNSGPIGPDTNLAAPNSPAGALTGGAAATSDGRALKQAVNFRLPNGRKTRVIIIDWEKLQKGDLTQNVLIRDRKSVV